MQTRGGGEPKHRGRPSALASVAGGGSVEGASAHRDCEGSLDSRSRLRCNQSGITSMSGPPSRRRLRSRREARQCSAALCAYRLGGASRHSPKLCGPGWEGGHTPEGRTTRGTPELVPPEGLHRGRRTWRPTEICLSAPTGGSRRIALQRTKRERAVRAPVSLRGDARPGGGITLPPRGSMPAPRPASPSGRRASGGRCGARGRRRRGRRPRARASRRGRGPGRRRSGLRRGSASETARTMARPSSGFMVENGMPESTTSGAPRPCLARIAERSTALPSCTIRRGSGCAAAPARSPR